MINQLLLSRFTCLLIIMNECQFRFAYFPLIIVGDLPLPTVWCGGVLNGWRLVESSGLGG